ESARSETAALREQLARDAEALREQAARETRALREQASEETRALREQSARDTEALGAELAALRAEWRAWAEAQPSTWEKRLDRLERYTFLPLPRWASLGLFSVLLSLAFLLGMVMHG